MRAGSVYEFFKKNLITVAATVSLLLTAPLQAALKDPTRPPNMVAAVSTSPKKNQQPRWMLTSTLISMQRRTAVINDTVVSRGDHINGAKIISIQPSSVRLRIGGKDLTLIMLKKNIKSLSQVMSSRQGK